MLSRRLDGSARSLIQLWFRQTRGVSLVRLADFYHRVAETFRDGPHLILYMRNLSELQQPPAGKTLHFDTDMINPLMLIRLFPHALQSIRLIGADASRSLRLRKIAIYPTKLLAKFPRHHPG